MNLKLYFMLNSLVEQRVAVDNYNEVERELIKLIYYDINGRKVIIGLYNNKISNLCLDMGEKKIIFEKKEEEYICYLWREKKEFNGKKGTLEEEIFNTNLKVDSFLPFEENGNYFIKIIQN